MLEIRDLASVRALASTGSFESAARALGITPGAMSQRIKQLEDRLGQIVVVRTNPVRLTSAGETLLGLAQQVELVMADTIHSLTNDEISSTVTVAVNHDSLASWFLHAVTDFAARSATTLDIRCADQAVTSSLLRSGSAVAAVSAESEPPQGCEVIFLGGFEYVAVCTPAFLQEWFGDAGRPRDGCPVLMFEYSDSLSRRIAEQMKPVGGTTRVHYLPDSNAILAAAIKGMGWAVVPGLMASKTIDSGDLVAIAPRSRLVVPLYLHYWRLGSATLNLLVACIRRSAAQHLISR
ncbi:LysR family transcriptional regulator (chromosome initiation inhibitor) [Mesorhizobium soli]|uniref:ArgP/LysG family DNA-binding transcriptional regulator n=1 Tax=Pseudaminobacter soli (ex Li et al. 2025) TaxID=1295366 RepID=UPI0024738DE1|nr:ArgP/LysG family DNA-binding transcriptional regulator [Mesorhizobium soli]MDH6233154.1 LysR family transcriptional regulator (chromosome initiation inhibitor) [Mesorhizobium soli]